MRPLGLLLAIVLGAGLAASAYAQAATLKAGASGLPVPRFVSLKSDRVNVRKGPSTEHPVAWVFNRAGLPVEVIAEFDNWRQVRDSEGTEGWVFHSLLSGRRTALVSPWVKDGTAVALHESRSGTSDTVARLEIGVLGSVLKCDGGWCRFSVDAVAGWIEQEKLWGVYKNEQVE